jgi:hypothetical protein
VPAEHGELAGGGDDRDLQSAAGADALVEGAQRTGDACGGEGGLDQHSARLGAALLGDPSMCGGM